jgi:hypothetical protein
MRGWIIGVGWAAAGGMALLALAESQAVAAGARLAASGATACPAVVEAPPPLLAGARGAGCVPPRL